MSSIDVGTVSSFVISCFIYRYIFLIGLRSSEEGGQLNSRILCYKR